MTVAEEMLRLGHSTTIHAMRPYPEMTRAIAERGLQLAIGGDSMPGSCDAVIAQDAASAYPMFARYPEARRAFVMHSLYELQAPPLVEEAVSAVIVLNDRIAARAGALAAPFETVRLRQPIDLERFRPRGVRRARPRRVLALGNNLRGFRQEMLRSACADLGLELVHAGRHGRPTTSPEHEISDADIVVGYGRTILEAMALGRAAYVWDYAGGDGWVTADSYEALEADGFSGAATDAVIDPPRLRADLAAYSPELGELGFDLVRKHHSASKHVEALVQILGASEMRAHPSPLTEMSRLVRLEWRATSRAAQLAEEARVLREQFELEHRRADAADERAAAAERELQQLRATRRYRVLRRLMQPLDRLRTRRP